MVELKKKQQTNQQPGSLTPEANNVDAFCACNAMDSITEKMQSWLQHLYDPHQVKIDINVQDLQLGCYELQKNILFYKLVQQQAILNDPNKAPPKFLQSNLLELMLQSCNNTGVIVVQGIHGVGKLMTTKFLVKNLVGRIMFCNCQSENTGCYRKWVI